MQHVKDQAQDGKELRVGDEPVRAYEHGLALDLEADMNDIAADFDAGRREGKQSYVGSLISGRLARVVRQKWPV